MATWLEHANLVAAAIAAPSPFSQQLGDTREAVDRFTLALETAVEAVRLQGEQGR